jgi:hypothetical protein
MPKIPLLSGEPINNEALQAGSTRFFSFSVVGTGATVKVALNSISGNADIFISKGKFPDSRSYDWASWKDTSTMDDITFNWADKKFAPDVTFQNVSMDGEYTITIFAQSTVVYSLSVNVDYTNVPPMGTIFDQGSSSSLSGGAIAGIVIGVVFGVGILIALILCFLRGVCVGIAGHKNKKAKNATAEAEAEAASHAYDEQHNEQSVNQVELSTMEGHDNDV